MTDLAHLAQLEGMTGVDLAEIEALASLQTRIDRKYLVPAVQGRKLLDVLRTDAAVLRIDGSAAFRYETVYFDTPDLDSYLSSAQGRRHRFKVRVRTYADSGLCVLEVKRKGGRGETIKVRVPHELDDPSTLGASARAFIEETLGRPGLGERLRPTLITSFVRSTLLDRRDGSRATLDAEIDLRAPGAPPSVLEGRVILETKSVGAATAADRWLWRQGFRPTSFSKFCVGMALTHADLPANRWNRVLRHHLGWTPDRKVVRAPNREVLPVACRALVPGVAYG